MSGTRLSGWSRGRRRPARAVATTPQDLVVATVERAPHQQPTAVRQHRARQRELTAVERRRDPLRRREPGPVPSRGAHAESARVGALEPDQADQPARLDQRLRQTPPSPSRKAAPEAPSSSLRCLAAAPAPTRGRPRPADTRPAANRSRARRPPRTPLSVGSGGTLVRGRPRAGHSPRPPEPGRTSAPRTMLAARSLGREPARSRPDNRRVQPELPEPPRASKTPGHLKNRPVHCQFRH